MRSLISRSTVPVTVALAMLGAGAAPASSAAFVDVDGDFLDDDWEVVNFGNITSQDQFGDPDADGRNNRQEYTDATDPLTYDGPSAPTIVSPACGSETTGTNVLVAGNAPTPQGTPLLYDFQLYSDPGLTIEVAHSIPLIPQGAGATSEWAVGLNLQENTWYYWHVRAKDQFTFGPFSTPACGFFVNTVNDPPSAPIIDSPLWGGSVDSSTPTLRVRNAVDPDDAGVRHVFEVYSDQALSQHVATSALILGGPATTSWQVNNANPAMQEDRYYYWRARAADPHGLSGPWSDTGKFLVNAVNTPPETPQILSPRDGDIVDLLRPPLVVLDLEDLDHDPLVYDWDLATDVTFGNILESGANAEPDPGLTTTFHPATGLEEDHRYCWRVRTDDGQITSAYNVACFLVSQANDPPNAPVPLRPAVDEAVTTLAPVFSWGPALDPEDEAITYELEVEDAAGEPVGQQLGISGSLALLAGELTDGQTYTWRVRAVDRQGAIGPFAADRSFRVRLASDPDDGCCTTDSGCRASRRPDGGLLVALGVGLLALRKRRRRRRR